MRRNTDAIVWSTEESDRDGPQRWRIGISILAAVVACVVAAYLWDHRAPAFLNNVMVRLDERGQITIRRGAWRDYSLQQLQDYLAEIGSNVTGADATYRSQPWLFRHKLEQVRITLRVDERACWDHVRLILTACNAAAFTSVSVRVHIADGDTLEFPDFVAQRGMDQDPELRFRPGDLDRMNSELELSPIIGLGGGYDPDAPDSRYWVPVSVVWREPGQRLFYAFPDGGRASLPDVNHAVERAIARVIESHPEQTIEFSLTLACEPDVPFGPIAELIVACRERGVTRATCNGLTAPPAERTASRLPIPQSR